MKKKNIFKLFNRPLTLKKEGYTYLTSLSNDNYNHYDQAVQDCYEMDGNEPSYGDWVKESLKDYKIDKYVTFHDGLLVIGDSSTRYYDTESFDLEYKHEQLPTYVEEMIEDSEARYVDLLAYAIWHLGFEKVNQTINSIDEYNNIYSDSEKIYISLRLDESEGTVKTVFVKDELWQNVDFLNEILQLNVPTEIVLSFLPEIFKQNNDNFYRDLFTQEPKIFKFLPEKMRADRDFVMTAVSSNGLILQKVAEEFKADKKVVTAALSNDVNAFEYVSPAIKSDTEIYSMYISRIDVKWDLNTLEHLSEELKANKDFILSLVSLNGFVLKDLSDEFKNDKEVVLSAVKQNGGALDYASDELKADKDVILASVSNSYIKDIHGNPGCSLEYASDELKADKEVVMMALSNKGHMQHSTDYTLSYVTDNLKADKEVVIAAVSNDGNALEHAAEALKSNKEVVMTAISCEGLSSWAYCIKHALKEFKSDKGIVKAIVSKFGGALEHASDKMKADIEVVMAAVANDGYALEHASEELKADNEVVMTAVSNEGGALKNASNTCKADKVVVMAAVSNNGYALKHVSDELKANKKVVMAAVASNKNALKYASEELQNDPDILELKG